jgi:hypothetical protein
MDVEQDPMDPQPSELVDWILVILLIVICVGTPIYFSDKFAKKPIRARSKPKIDVIKKATPPAGRATKSASPATKVSSPKSPKSQ